MSDYHVLQANDSKTDITVVMHFPVPDENNNAGKALIDCVAEDDFITKETRLPSAHIDQAEIDKIEAGEIIEVRIGFEFTPGLSDADIRAMMDIYYENQSAVAIGRIKARYAFWGFSRDIP